MDRIKPVLNKITNVHSSVSFLYDSFVSVIVKLY